MAALSLPIGLISQGRQIANPRTVLGFFAGVLVIWGGGCLTGVWILASFHVMLNLIPWILASAGVFFIALVVALFIVMLGAAHKLMLGPVSGSEYAEILKVGDSDRGERLEQVIGILPGSQRVPKPAVSQALGVDATEHAGDQP